ncbi:MAG TPA: 6-phosphogluconolactonase [Candidatus Limnocylindrales bacterium]|jgi:6-phosphogluconolactonase
MNVPRQPSEPELVVLADPDAVSAAAADRIADALRGAVAARGRADWATTGGSAPVGIYRRLAHPSMTAAVPWPDVHLWWSDDRYVPRDHPLSNVLPADQVLLAAATHAGQDALREEPDDAAAGPRHPGAPIPVDQVHAMPMSDALGQQRGPAWVAARYDAELRESGIATRDGWPVFDVMLLGVGPDGHVMSIFPGSDAFEEAAWVLPIPAPTHVEPHVTRVTLNPKVLDVARTVFVVMHGAGKADTVAMIFGPERDVRRWPAQLVRRPGVTWLLDEAAAARLPAAVR